MRALCCALVVLAACARESAQTPAQRFAGTWEGRSFRSAADTGVPWTVTLTVGTDGQLSGSLTFAGGSASVPIRVVEVTDSTIVQELGPYVSRTANAEVMTRSEGKLVEDSLVGIFEMRPTAGGEPIRGTYGAHRAAAP